MNSKKIIQFLLLGMMLIAFPAISWYYLKSGFDYQKKAFSELMDYGEVPLFSFPTVLGDSISNEELKDAVVVYGFVQEDQQMSEDLLKLYGRLHDQFHDRNEIQFVLFSLSPDQYPPDQVNHLATQFDLRDSLQIHFAITDKANAQQLAASEFKLPDFSQILEMGVPIPLNPGQVETTQQYPYLILARNGTIKNYYDYREENSVKRLVEHLALLMPREDRENSKREGQ